MRINKLPGEFLRPVAACEQAAADREPPPRLLPNGSHRPDNCW
jgi:hypothetical protein